MEPNHIQTVLRALPEIFPHRIELPKTLIFATNDTDADAIIKAARKEFSEGVDFCKKVTYGTTEDPKAALDFCNSYNPRIGVTVDMIVTDIKPLECLIVMRDVPPLVTSHAARK